MSQEESFTFVNVSHPDETRDKASQRLIRRRVMRDIGKSRRKKNEAPSISFTLQKTNERPIPNSIRPAFGSNPFPVDFNSRAQELMHFMNADSEYNYRPFRKVWFAMALGDHSAFMLCMANAAMFLDEARNPDTFRYEDSAEALTYYGQCVEQITARLSNPEVCTSEGVITTILGLICHDLHVGTLDRWAYHIHGLARLARLRGGFHDLSGDIQLFACWFDAMGSVARDQRPQLAEYYQPSVTSVTQLDLQNHSLHTIAVEFAATSPELVGILEILKQSAAVAEFVNTHSDHPEFWRTEVDLTPLQMLGPIMNQLLSLARCEYSTASPLEMVQELTRLSLLILIAELRSNYGMSARETLLLNTKFYQLLQSIEARQETVMVPKLQLWAIVTAALFQKSELKLKSYIKLISLRMEKMGIRDGDAAVKFARGVVWIDAVASQATVHNLITKIDVCNSKDI